MTTTWWRVAYQRPGAFTETRDDYGSEPTAQAAAETLRAAGYVAVVYAVQVWGAVG